MRDPEIFIGPDFLHPIYVHPIEYCLLSRFRGESRNFSTM